MDPATGYCEGCYRTIEEIADWGVMADDRKRCVWQALRRRRAELNPVAPTMAPAQDMPSPALTSAPAGQSLCEARLAGAAQAGMQIASSVRRPGATEPPFVGPKTPPEVS